MRSAEVHRSRPLCPDTYKPIQTQAGLIDSCMDQTSVTSKSDSQTQVIRGLELIDEVLNFLRKRIQEPLDLAVDVGCGSGQGTELLAPHFMTVVGTDISSAQLEIASAKDHAANLCYRQSPAEELPFEDDMADLVISMTAAHWFDHPLFLREADRILRPGGCLALLSYTMDFELEYGESTSKLNQICQEFYAALHPFRKAYIGSSSLQVYKKIYDLVSYDDKEWHECLKVRMMMPLSRFIGLVESFSTYQGFLEKDPVEAKRLSQTITDRCVSVCMLVCAGMLTLASKLKREEGMRAGRTSAGSNDASHRVSIRDRLLIKEVAELETNLPNTCKVTFPDENKLHHFQLAISPDEGYYLGGKFQFEIEVLEAYNMVVSACNIS
ncbi:unnamed protein product [Leuciscus chuanchicus]